MVKKIVSSNINIKKNQLIKPKYVFANDIINYSGLLLKDDFNKVKEIQQEYINYSNLQLNEIITDNANKMKKYFGSKFNETTMVLDYLICSVSSGISKSFIKKIKFYKLFDYAISMLNEKKENKMILYPTTREYVVSKKEEKYIPLNTKDSLLENPINIAEKIVGYVKNSDGKNIINKTYRKKGLKEIFEIQEGIVKKILFYIIKNGSIENFKYTKNEYNKIKNLLDRYHMTNRILKQYGINIEGIESLLYTPLIKKDLNIGETLYNSEIIIDKALIYDKKEKKQKNVIITFVNTNLGCRLKIYNYSKNILNNNFNLKKLYYKYVVNNDIKNLNLLNDKCLDFIDNNEVGEVFFEFKNRKEMSVILSNYKNLDIDFIKNTLSNKEQFIIIRNLKNNNIERFYNISSILIKNLKRLLLKNYKNDIYIEAQAYNNVKHSPVALYLRAGCKPISHSEDELKNIIENSKKDYDTSVLFLYPNSD